MRLFEQRQVRKGNQLIEAKETALDKPGAPKIELVGNLLKPRLAVPANRIVNSLIATATQKQSRDAEIDLNDIERVTKNDSMTASEYRTCVLAIGRLAYAFLDSDDDTYIVIPLFDKIIYRKGSKKIQARFSESAAYYINKDTPFTQYELADYLALSSKYSQALFERLKKWEKYGQWETQLTEFQKILNFPDGYKKNMGELKRRVLEPVRKELKEKINFSFTYKITKKKPENIDGTYINILFLIGKQEETPKVLKPKQAAYLCARNIVNKKIACDIYNKTNYEFSNYDEEKKCEQCKICKYIDNLRQKKLKKQAAEMVLEAKEASSPLFP